jgi:carboxymethylenebutenolidase
MNIRRLLSRTLIGLLILFGLIVIVVGGIILADSLFPDQRVTDFANVTYPGSDGQPLHAYLARPSATGPTPAILLIHEFFGLNADIVQKADLLAEQGYTVLAVDAYRGKTTRQLLRAIWLVMTTSQKEIDADFDAGFEYLAQLPEVDPARIGVVGFCFGGTQALRLGTRNPDLAANVIFYGSGLVTDPDQLGVLGANGPVLGIFGEQDRSIPLEKVFDFEQALQDRGTLYRVSIYPGVGHAFVTPGSLSEPGSAQQAWNEMLGFLDESLH